MPEQLIGKIRKSILPQWKVCFLTALVVGLIAHLYKITNWLPNWDSLVFRYDSQNMISMGRWFLPVVCSMSSFYDLPFITGIMAIVFHGLGAVVICKMFDVRKNITASLVGAVVVTFPTVTSVLMYNYVADGYAFAFLLSCIAAAMLTKDRPSYVCSAILIALSVGIYQAYVTVTIMLLVLFLIFEVMNKDTDVKKTIIRIVKFILTGAVGMTLYYLVLTLLLKITGTALLEYQGFDNAVSFKEVNIVSSLYVVIHLFVDYFFDFSNGLSAFNLINCIVFALTLVFGIAYSVKNRLNITKLMLLCALVVLLPVGASVLAFINSGVDYHNLMKMGFVVFYLLFILLYEKSDCLCEKFNSVKAWSILAVSVVLVFNNTLIANISYHKLNIAYEKSYGVLIRIADRIEQTEGVESCTRILVVGELAESEAYSANLPPDMTGTTDGYILRADDETVGQSVLCSALNDYCGKNYNFVAGEEKNSILDRIDAENMGDWPSKNSITVIDDVIVIKLSN